MTVGEEPETPAPPRLRRDARRNRERLVEAAHAVFAEQGLEAPLDVIARRAGVGNATLYRHFPTRAALVDAVFRDQLTGTMEAGERARRAPDAWAGLAGYLDAVFVTLAADRGTNDLMTTRLPDVETLGAVHAHNRETVDVLLERARAQGSVRADVTTEDLLFALAALGRAVPPLAVAAGPDAWRRPLALFLEGLRGPGREPRPLPGRPLDEEELGQVLGEMGPHRARPTDGSAGGAAAGHQV
ncbi:TetR/AcrR family transcriptional regulator [Streptomyces albogriseolus]|uniref:Helix-turn-helix domain-containing protein n=2 Tax=Streptomyces albogriseolus group TaxID=2867120 RepID=A0ABP6U728_9ACTN|nr:TetR/AcrR family transcriptional regulator [Streptomyces viridodiastaticus]MCX4568031.1 TetR/AcrR family transcriptional regulator [Streptomyces viridodiastaticus]GHB92034.1 TetR family transcriptional regulator [Streptomyces albogriseolus]